MNKPITLKAWAEVGPNGKLLMFLPGPMEYNQIGNEYPGLLEIYTDKLSEKMVPVTIIIHDDTV